MRCVGLSQRKSGTTAGMILSSLSNIFLVYNINRQLAGFLAEMKEPSSEKSVLRYWDPTFHLKCVAGSFPL